MQQVEEDMDSLLALYIKRREGLLAELDQCSEPAAIANRVNSFVRELERPYTDLPDVTAQQSRLIHHALGIVATTVETLAAVSATASLSAIGDEDVVTKPSNGWLKGFLLEKFLPVQYWMESSPAVRYLWLIATACIVSVALVLLSSPSIIAVILLFAIGALAVILASSVRYKEALDAHALSLQEPQVTFAFALNNIDGTLSRALRATDDLLSVAAHKATQDADTPALSSDRVLELLQDIISHKITKSPDKTIDDLVKDSIRLLYAAGIAIVDYSSDQAKFFEKQPAGIPEQRTLLPALVSEDGKLVRPGTILVPVSTRSN